MSDNLICRCPRGEEEDIHTTECDERSEAARKAYREAREKTERSRSTRGFRQRLTGR